MLCRNRKVKLFTHHDVTFGHSPSTVHYVGGGPTSLQLVFVTSSKQTAAFLTPRFDQVCGLNLDTALSLQEKEE